MTDQGVRPNGAQMDRGRLHAAGALRVRHLLSAVVLVLVFSAGVGAERFVWDGGQGAGASSSFTDVPEFQILQETWNLIKDEYVEIDQISDRELIYGASRGMVDALGDTGHSRFLDPDEAQEFEQSTRGEFIGVGVYIDIRDNFPVVVAPIDGTPADEAGIRAGDVILEVNGESTQGMSLTEVGQVMRGEEGTEVTLTLRRADDETAYTLTLTRQRIVVDPVSWAMLPENIALIRLNQFSGGATEKLRDAITDAEAAGALAIIFDLRSNPGGLVYEAIGVASQFMPEGTTIYQERNAEGQVRSVTTVGTPRAPDLPMAVLVNGGSASAAEIVAGALRDNGRATLIGETTFGTGTVLLPHQLSDGSIALLGSALWLTADGEQIWKQGVDPDQVVELPAGVVPHRPSDGEPVTVRDLRQLEDEQLLAAYEQVTEMVLATAPRP